MSGPIGQFRGPARRHPRSSTGPWQTTDLRSLTAPPNLRANYLWSGLVTDLASIHYSPTTVLRPYVPVRADVNTDFIKTCAACDPIACALATITGVGPVLRLTLRAEIGDGTRFPAGPALASDAGLVPRVESRDATTGCAQALGPAPRREERLAKARVASFRTLRRPDKRTLQVRKTLIRPPSTRIPHDPNLSRRAGLTSLPRSGASPPRRCDRA
jgi:hypothetical protein